jgi:glutamyl-tRNA synthetase/glutamyl-Q tRNA(Asp) synthetase
MPDAVSRFAPAPTGFLHLGHIVNAIHVWRITLARRGRVLLRIEDHDRQRSRAEFEDAIVEDLAWLGFDADEPLVRQSDRGAIYEEALQKLRDLGLVYACECSRADIVRAANASPFHADDLRYAGACAEKHLTESPDRGLRVRLAPSVERFDDLRLGPQEQRPSEQCGDLLVRDRDGNWTYQFAATVDDFAQGVTLVIRGEDLLASTGRQIQLARLLGRPEPATFLHHPLIMKSATQKLSKSDGDTGIRELRAKGWSAADVIDRAERLVQPDRSAGSQGTARPSAGPRPPIAPPRTVSSIMGR